jgi:hypothetical protein
MVEFLTTAECLGERLGHGIARHLPVSGEGDEGAPQTSPVLPIQALQPACGRHQRTLNHTSTGRGSGARNPDLQRRQVAGPQVYALGALGACPSRIGLVPVGVRTGGRTSVETMKVYNLTIQENGHSRRSVYEDRDEALKRLPDATAAELDAKLDEVVRAPALPRLTERLPDEIVPVRHH